MTLKKSSVVEWSRPIYFDWVKLETGGSKEGEEGKEGEREKQQQKEAWTIGLKLVLAPAQDRMFQ